MSKPLVKRIVLTSNHTNIPKVIEKTFYESVPTLRIPQSSNSEYPKNIPNEFVVATNKYGDAVQLIFSFQEKHIFEMLESLDLTSPNEAPHSAFTFNKRFV